jgi:hypothetical protein
MLKNFLDVGCQETDPGKRRPYGIGTLSTTAAEGDPALPRLVRIVRSDRRQLPRIIICNAT